VGSCGFVEVVKVSRGVIESLTHEAAQPGDVLSHAVTSEKFCFEGNHQMLQQF
jgi:hypothetical protein